MIAVTTLLLVGLAMVGLLLLLGLRRWTLEETRTDALLRSPDAPTVAYRVPDGKDPVVLMASLSRSGFVSVVDDAGGTERLLVACDARERGTVRSIIEQVDRGGVEGPELHAAPVTFEDEDETSPT